MQDFQSPRIGPLPLLLAGLLAGVCAAGMALFTGFIPGHGANRDLYDAAALISTREVREAACANCGVIEDIREVETPPRTRDIAFPGAADMLGVTAAVFVDDSGAYRAVANKRYLLTVRMTDGRRHVASIAGSPGFAIGDAVMLSPGGKLVPGGIET